MDRDNLPIKLLFGNFCATNEVDAIKIKPINNTIFLIIFYFINITSLIILFNKETRPI